MAFCSGVRSERFAGAERYLKECERKVREISDWTRKRQSQVPEALTVCMFRRLDALLANLVEGRQALRDLRKVAATRTDVKLHALSLLDTVLDDQLARTRFVGKRELVRAAFGYAALSMPKAPRQGIENFVHAVTMRINRVRTAPVRKQILSLALMQRINEQRNGPA
jgi:hypothetical protein